MCGRVILLTYEELLGVLEGLSSSHGDDRLQQLDLELRGGSEGQRPQARPGAKLATLVPADNGRFETRELTWGFSAAWQGAKGKLVYNTRLESALRREGMWASAVAHGRCILPVAAFFEPHRSETQRSPRTGRQGKRPYVFTRRDEHPLLIAGVHEHEQLSLLTTEPNVDVSPVHPRMPLVLEPHEVRLWLEGDIAQLADRSRVKLSVRPEYEGDERASVQQSLF